MSKKNNLNVLLIDDDAGFSASLKNRAAGDRIMLKVLNNLQDGMEVLEDKKIQAVILDGKAFLRPEQVAGTEKSSFVHEAIDRLHKLEDKQKRYIPFCVLTAFFTQLEESLDGRAVVFNKKEDEDLEKMFNYLKEEVSKAPETHILRMYPKVFNVMDQHFDQTDIELLLGILPEQNLNSSEEAKIVISLQTLRRLNEKLFDVLCVKYLSQDVSQFVERSNWGRRTITLFDEFETRGLIPSPIYACKSIYYTASKYGDHNKIDPSDPFFPSSYTVKSLTFGLLEAILWAGTLIENQNPPSP